MELTLRQRVQIDRLLLEREEQFVRVHACETAIHEILRGSYPFPPPPPLPSQRKRRKPARKKRGSGASPDVAHAPLPPLDAGGVAYRFIFRRNEAEFSEVYPTRDALQRWLATERHSVRPLRVEVIDAGGQVVRIVRDYGAS